MCGIGIKTMMKHITIIIALFFTIFASVSLAETSYVLNTFYVNQTDLSNYEKKMYSSTSISTNVGYLYKNIESCRSALKDSFLENTTDPEKDVAFQYMMFFFEDDDDFLRDTASSYRAGTLLAAEMKQLCIDRALEWMNEHAELKAQNAHLVNDFLAMDAR